MSKNLLNDNQAHDALLEARDLLMRKSGLTKRAETALRAADTALGALAFGLLSASERGHDGNDALIDPEMPLEP